MSLAAFWTDPVFDNTDMLLDVVDVVPSLGLTVLANPNLSSHHLDRILPKVGWSSDAVHNVGAAEILAPWNVEDQERIIRAALKKSKAAANVLLDVARIGTRLRLWRAANTGNFAGAAELRRRLPGLMSKPAWGYLADDPDYLPTCAAVWNHFQDVAPHLITNGQLACDYALGATTDEHHERLVELMRHVTDPTWHVSSLLASTHGEPDRVLWWSDQCELGAVLAAADPRLDAATRKALPEPVTERLAGMFRYYQHEYEHGRELDDVEVDVEDEKDELVETLRGLLASDDVKQFRSSLEEWAVAAEALINAQRPPDRIPAENDFDWLLGRGHLASDLVALDIVTSHGPQHTHYREALERVWEARLRPAVWRGLEPSIIPATKMPAQYLVHDHNTDWEPRYVDATGEMVLWHLWQKYPGPLRTANHYMVARYVAGHLTTAMQLVTFRRKLLRLSPAQQWRLDELVEEVLAEVPAPATSSAPAADVFAAVLGDALGSL